MPGKWLSKMCLASREIFFVAAPREETLSLSLASTHQTAGENNDKSRNSQVLTKILNYELIHKNQQQQQQYLKIYVTGLYLTHISPFMLLDFFCSRAPCTLAVLVLGGSAQWAQPSRKK